MGKKKIHIADVVRSGEAISIPESMSLKAAVEVLTRQLNEQETYIDMHAMIPCFIPDGANALQLAMKELYGFAQTVGHESWFGMVPPDMITVEVGVDETAQIPWGPVPVPGIDDDKINMGRTLHEGRAALRLTTTWRRKYEKDFERIVDEVKRQLREHSIYRGKAFRLRLSDDDGDPLEMPQPKFFQINPSLKDELTFPRNVEQAIRVSVFSPIIHREKAKALGVPVKRGVLLYGDFGTGKSMTSAVVADLATTHGWTYILVEHASELPDVLRLARNYEPVVVFCEDVDKVFQGHRTMDMDEILNVIDGVESKDAEIMTIFTTNVVKDINRAALRPGRLDAVIEVTAPDAEAVERLIRLYARGLVADDEPLGVVSSLLDGSIPAVVQETVERSKLAALYRDPDFDAQAGSIREEDLVAAAHSMHDQTELLRGVEPDTRSEVVKAAAITAEAITSIHRNGHDGPVVVPVNQ